MAASPNPVHLLNRLSKKNFHSCFISDTVGCGYLLHKSGKTHEARAGYSSISLFHYDWFQSIEAEVPSLTKLVTKALIDKTLAVCKLRLLCT